MSFNFENLDAYFADFGEVATWKGSTLITAIFDNAYQLAGGLVEGTNPVIVVQAADVPGMALDDAIVFRSVSYTVKGIEPDVSGDIVTVQLEAV